jgi:thiol-disulfide isomerase/thioredoxin
VQQGLSWSGHEHNHTFLNLGGGRFADVSRLTRCDCEGDGRSAAIVDWDDDGRLDVLLKNRTGPRLQVFHNRAAAGNHLVVELEGNGTTSNRDAVGAIVTVEAGGRSLRRTLRAGEGFLAQSTKRLHFGLAGAERVERLGVAWPDGTRSTFEGLDANTRVLVRQGAEAPEPVPARTVALERLPHREAEKIPGKVTRTVLSRELPLGPLRLPAYDAPDRTVADLAGRPFLLNVWQEECAGCIREFALFEREGERLRELGLRIVPLNADLDLPAEEAVALLERIGLETTDAGRVDDFLAEALFDVVYSDIYPPRSNLDMPMPTSFLFDGEGNLLVIYNGPVSLDELEADVPQLTSDDPRPVLDRLRGGMRMVHFERDLEGLAQRLEERADGPDRDPGVARELRSLAGHFREVDARTGPYVFVDGERRPLGERGLRRRGKRGGRSTAGGDAEGN